MSSNTIGYLLAGLTVLAWGLIVIPIKMSSSPGGKGIAFSMLGGIVTLSPFFLHSLAGAAADIASLPPSTVFFIVAGGICQFPAATVCYYEAIKSAEISTVVPLKSLKVAMVVGLVFVFNIEMISATTLLGCLTGIAGAFVLTGRRKKSTLPQASRDKGTANMKRGIIMALLACLFWSMGDILIREAVEKLPSTIVTPLALSCGAVGYYLWIIFRKKLRQVFAIPLRDKICYLAHGIVSFGIGYCAFFAAMSYIGISRTVIISNAWPLVAFLVGIVVYREKMTFRKLAGTALLMGSVYIVIV